MARFTHMMVDTETTGVDPSINGVIQIAAIKFNPDTFEVGPAFDACPSILPRRVWSDSTRRFWSGHREIYESIVARERPYDEVYREFSQFATDDAPFGGYTFVAKPTKFDWPILESQYLQLGLPFPFAHWNTLDLHSCISGLRGVCSRTNIEDEVPFTGAKHNALHDCAYQIDLLFHAKRNHISAEIVR